MKKKISAIILLLVLCLSVLAACSGGDYLTKASQSADNYTLTLSYDSQNHKLSAHQRVEMTNRSDNAFETVKFHIYANQYRQDAANSVVPDSYQTTAYPNGKSYGNITMDVVSVNEQEVAFVIEGNDSDILSVPLGFTLFPDQKATIDMVYEVTLANIEHRLGYTDNTVNLGNFYPVLCVVKDGNYSTTPYYSSGDPFVTDIASYNVSITVPNTYMVACTGDLLEVDNSDASLTTYNYSAKAVRDWAAVLSDKFTKLTSTVGNTQISYYYYADKTPEATLASAVATLNFMNEFVSTYPYKELVVAETDFCFGGMEYPNLAMVSSGTTEYLEATVHEIIHQWFYGIVGNDQIENAWMDEGLTEFLTMLAMDKSNTATLSSTIKQMYKAYTTYVDVLTHYNGSLDTSLRPIYEYSNDKEYVYMTYVKGSILFYNLYDTMGESKFSKALQTYFNQCRMTTAYPQQMIDAFTKAFGADTSSVFSAFIEGKDIIYDKTVQQ